MGCRAGRRRERLSERAREYLELADGDRQRRTLHYRLSAHRLVLGHGPPGRVPGALDLRLVQMAVRWRRARAIDGLARDGARVDRKSTRLNSSHMSISYAVFCLKK